MEYLVIKSEEGGWWSWTIRKDLRGLASSVGLDQLVFPHRISQNLWLRERKKSNLVWIMQKREFISLQNHKVEEAGLALGMAESKASNEVIKTWSVSMSQLCFPSFVAKTSL